MGSVSRVDNVLFHLPVLYTGATVGSHEHMRWAYNAVRCEYCNDCSTTVALHSAHVRGVKYEELAVG
eukprot:scaffold33602_cov26-Tisochrysis_lutea.AAC.6